MKKAADHPVFAQPQPTRISRTFAAPRALVFKAWSTAEHVRRWFPPHHYSGPASTVDPRIGGAFEICMRGPDGVEHWSRGVFAEVVENQRLVIDMHADDGTGKPLFRAYTEVNFIEVPEGTRLDVVQTYTLYDERALQMVGGAPIGWGQSLEKLAAELQRMQGAAAVKRSVVHGTFSVERTYDAPAPLVFKALSDFEAKRRWFGGDPGQWEELERTLDFRVGGLERVRGRWAAGEHRAERPGARVVSCFDAVYHDIVPGQRIVYSYVMHLDELKISVSLATMELKPAGEGRTTLVVTEHGAFLDGYEDAGSREQGTRGLLERIGKSLLA